MRNRASGSGGLPIADSDTGRPDLEVGKRVGATDDPTYTERGRGSFSRVERTAKPAEHSFSPMWSEAEHGLVRKLIPEPVKQATDACFTRYKSCR